MGALLSQAVANQLRQVLGFQDPHPSPPTLIQQVLNPPGPSRPTWMAGPMERQQLLATNTQEARQALSQDALRMALSFGGADITKEQRAAWEEENIAYRARKDAPKAMEPGTRVAMRPWGQRTANPASAYGPGKLKPNQFGDMAGGTGVVVTPGTPEAGEPAYTPSTEATRRPPTPDHVAVRGEQSGHWFWRHRDSLEVLPPRQFYKIFGITDEPGGASARASGHEWHLSPEEANSHFLNLKDNEFRDHPPLLVRTSEPPASFERQGDAFVARPLQSAPEAARIQRRVGIRTEKGAPVVAPEHIEVQVGKDQWIPLLEWIKRGGK